MSRGSSARAWAPVGAALLLVAGAASPGALPSPGTAVPPRTLFGATLGASRPELRAALGEPDSVQRAGTTLGWIWGRPEGNAWRLANFAVESPDRVLALQITAGAGLPADVRVETGLPGLRLGDPADRVRERLGAPADTRALARPPGTRWEYPDANLSVEIADGRLRSVRIHEDLIEGLDALVAGAREARASGRAAESLAGFERAVLLAPRSPEALAGLGDALRRAGKSLEGCARLREARDAQREREEPPAGAPPSLDISLPELTFGLAACALEEGDRDAAAAEVARWRALGQRVPADFEPVVLRIERRVEAPRR